MFNLMRAGNWREVESHRQPNVPKPGNGCRVWSTYVAQLGGVYAVAEADAVEMTFYVLSSGTFQRDHENPQVTVKAFTAFTGALAASAAADAEG